MKAKKIRTMLGGAFRTGSVVRLSYAPNPKEIFFGYVVGLSRDFVTLHLIDGDLMCLNGYTVFPIIEVTKLIEFGYASSIYDRAFALKGISPVRPQSLANDDFPSLLASIDAHFPLLTIHTGHLYPDECYIGRVAKLSRKKITLREIDPEARWNRVEKYRYDDITRIDFGGGYEDALWRVSENERSIAERAKETE